MYGSDISGRIWYRGWVFYQSSHSIFAHFVGTLHNLARRIRHQTINNDVSLKQKPMDFLISLHLFQSVLVLNMYDILLFPDENPQAYHRLALALRDRQEDHLDQHRARRRGWGHHRQLRSADATFLHLKKFGVQIKTKNFSQTHLASFIVRNPLGNYFTGM